MGGLVKAHHKKLCGGGSMITFGTELVKDEQRICSLLKVEIFKKGFRVATVWFSREGAVRIEPEFHEAFTLEELFRIIQEIEPIATDFLFELNQKLLYELPDQFYKALSEPDKPMRAN